jgi:hypothetical protein
VSILDRGACTPVTRGCHAAYTLASGSHAGLRVATRGGPQGHQSVSVPDYLALLDAALAQLEAGLAL